MGRVRCRLRLGGGVLRGMIRNNNAQYLKNVF